MAYPYGTLPVPITDATVATPNTHSGHHQSVHAALNDLLTELATAPRSLTGLHAGLLAVKVWSSTQYVWSGGTAPDSNSYTNIVFVDPAGTHNPASSTGGRSVANDLWETGAISGGGGSVAADTIWDTKGDLAVATAADTAAKLAVGTNGQILTADSTQTTGIKWATAVLTASTQSGSYTFVPGDNNTVVEGTSASAQTFTIATFATQALPVGAVIEVYQSGAGQVTVAAGGGVTLRAPNGAKTAHQYSTMSIRQRATDEWVLAGDSTT